ncbi:MAG: T9SS type A sorting domain-containing protein [Melioribacteraceae bacterium]|nr:T9SS type A sorting domain-containing protein [Melioribacteraceae bacterium]
MKTLNSNLSTKITNKIKMAFRNNFHENFLNLFFVISLLFLSTNISAQAFTEISVALQGVNEGNAKWGDYDNDGDLDFAVMGNGQFNVYRNDGNNTFTDISANIPGIRHGSFSWGDYDGDNDLDLLVMGYSQATGSLITNVYQNTNGSFADISAGLLPLWYGNCEWGDYDNDNDLDILINGENNGYAASPGTYTIVYQNNSGVFSDISAGLTGTSYGQTSWGDYDNDNDLDIVVTGTDASSNVTSKIYRNDSGTYNDISAVMTGVLYSSVDWGDYDNDNDLDLIVSGQNSSGTKISIIYGNSSGTFSDISAGLTGATVGGVKWGDIDNDNDLDLLISGAIGPDDYSSTVYRNDSGTFTDISAGLPALSGPSCDWGDYDNDGYIDLLLTGDDAGSSVSKIYNNHRFTIDASAVFTNLYNGTADWGDYDNDGDLDVIIAGTSSATFSSITEIFENNGDGTFTFDANSNSLTGAAWGAIRWGDYDNDGDLDIAQIGITNSGNIAVVYQNNAGIFSDINAGLTAVKNGSIEWGDYDNDGDLDLLVVGEDDSNNLISKVYKNTGGTFSDISAGLTGIFYGTAKWGDYDGDGDLDIALSGATSAADKDNSPLAKIYRNVDGSFVDISASLVLVANSGIAWGDYDSDGDLDLVLCGMDASDDMHSNIYNNNAGVFTDISAGLTGVHKSTIGWGDYDNDGDLDLLIHGSTSYGYTGDTELYKNFGSDTFVPVAVGLVDYAEISIANWADYDNDGDLDIIASGIPPGGNVTNGTTKLFENMSPVLNTSPNAPSNLSASTSGTSVTFSWDKATDSETTQNGLTYNLRIGTSSGGSDIFSGMVNAATGYRRIVDIGNMGHNNSRVIGDLSAANYYWSVQTIDNNYKGSAFASEGSFFTEGFTSVSAGFYNSSRGASEWGDYDNDGDLDVLITGSSNTVLYKNTNGSFSSVSTSLTVTSNGYAAWGDYDNDGGLDIALIGTNGSSVPTSKIYRNDGGDTFTDISAALTGVNYGSCDWGDYDNDGDLDLAITGNIGSSVGSTKIYTNNNGVFTDASISLTGAFNSFLKWVDIDNDKDLDLFVLGHTGSGKLTKIYRNDGGGSFTSIITNLPNVGDCNIAFGDYDSDGDIDIAMPYLSSTGVYSNNGSGGFSKVWSGPSLTYGFADWGDYDNDGDLDLLLAGWIQVPSEKITRVYRNDGSNTFVDISAGLTGLQQGAASWGDYDGDNDLDLAVIGYTGSVDKTIIYENFRNTSNTAPNAPSNLATSVNDNTITFSWDKATDAQTSQNALTYNLVVGTTDGGSDVFSGMVNATSGYRRIPTQGNTGHTNSWTLNNLTNGQSYYWKVQTIDNTFTGSVFTAGTSEQALPVELTYFTATSTSSAAVLLNWETATEVNNYGFEIERASFRKDGTTPVRTGLGDGATPVQGDWSTLGFVPGHGNSNSPKDYSFVDANSYSGKIQYRLKQIDTDGAFEYSEVIEVEARVLGKYLLEQNYPNPFNPTTNINFSIAKTGNVKLTIYNTIGQKVATLFNGVKKAGSHKISFNATNLMSGVYFYRLVADSYGESGSFVQVEKMLLLK